VTAGLPDASGGDALVRPVRHLFLSPHYDDIALSVGGSVAKLSDAGRRVEEAILFSAEPDPAAPLTPFAAAMHAGWGLAPDEVIAGRRREETTAAALLGMEVRLLPFQDAIYRGERYLDNADLFGPVASDEADLPAKIARALASTDRPDAGRRLYAPLAIGGHVDHQLAFAAGIDLARSGHEVWFYEDLPYALKPANRAARMAALTAAGIALAIAAVVDVTAVWERKLSAIEAYPSQLPTVFGGGGSGHTRRAIDAQLRRYAEEIGGGVGSERFWRLAEPIDGR
jgi:LmbE family N-acetylglucosaminyl deacetylase